MHSYLTLYLIKINYIYYYFVVSSMKTLLSEMYNNNFVSLAQKENKLLELEKQIKECNISNTLKVN